MEHETTINELARYAALFDRVDHITVTETNPDTGTTEEVTLPPPLIRRTQRRDDSIWWILTPPGIHERIIVADQATVTVYLKDIDPARFTGHLPPTPAAPPQPPTAWPQQSTPYPPLQAPAPPTTTPHTRQRAPAPWSNQQH
ncbi:hypothetical protein [Streptomyces griseus]|uniref:hypothetical protein n=1 Tax=Streptomyces griseus TaxID=1911 RepID=UPI002151B37E|nr:hypothetical protein [Streptomyces griseus]